MICDFLWPSTVCLVRLCEWVHIRATGRLVINCPQLNAEIADFKLFFAGVRQNKTPYPFTWRDIYRVSANYSNECLKWIYHSQPVHARDNNKYLLCNPNEPVSSNLINIRRTVSHTHIHSSKDEPNKTLYQQQTRFPAVTHNYSDAYYPGKDERYICRVRQCRDERQNDFSGTIAESSSCYKLFAAG